MVATTEFEQLRKDVQSANCSVVFDAAEQLSARGAYLGLRELAHARACIPQMRGAGSRMALTHDYLRLLDPEEGAVAAAALIRRGDLAVRDEAFMALVDYGPASMPELRSLVTERDDGIRWHACEAIRCIGGSEAVPLLVELLKDSDFAVRWSAVRGLIEIGPDVTLPVLRALVKGRPTRQFHTAARWVLERQRPPGLRDELNPLIESLSRETTVDQSARLALELLTKTADSHPPGAHEPGERVRLRRKAV